TPDVGSTAHALLTFLGSGYTNRSDDSHGYGKSVASALRFLKDRQGENGAFGASGTPTAGRDNAVATLAMVEVYGMTGSSIYQGPARRALQHLLRARLSSGGWSTEGGPSPT